MRRNDIEMIEWEGQYYKYWIKFLYWFNGPLNWTEEQSSEKIFIMTVCCKSNQCLYNVAFNFVELRRKIFRIFVPLSYRTSKFILLIKNLMYLSITIFRWI